MGISGISPFSLLIVLAIVVLLFGSKKIRSLGKDVGEAIKGFREGLQDNRKK